MIYFLLQDESINLASLPENKQTYIGYLDKALDSILEVRQCTVNRMTLCITSEAEMEKCIKMRVNKFYLSLNLILYNGWCSNWYFKSAQIVTCTQ